MNEPVDILLVEDNPNDVELTLHAFNKLNITNSIQVVRDGQEALDYLFCEGDFKDRQNNHNPKIVLLDLKLPKIDGIEVLRRVKSDPRTRQMPVTVLTSSREERDILQSYDLGVNSYIVKPLDFDQFNEAIRQLGLYWLLVNLPPVSTG